MKLTLIKLKFTIINEIVDIAVNTCYTKGIPEIRV